MIDKIGQVLQKRFRMKNPFSPFDYKYLAEDFFLSMLKDASTVGVLYRDSCGETLLSYAIMDDKRRVVKRLLDLGADTNNIGNSGITPLHYAARKKDNRELAQLLIDKGADLGYVNNIGVEGVKRGMSFGYEESPQKGDFVEWGKDGSLKYVGEKTDES